MAFSLDANREWSKKVERMCGLARKEILDVRSFIVAIKAWPTIANIALNEMELMREEKFDL